MPPIGGNAGVPGGRIVADEEIGARGHRVDSLQRDIGIRACEAHVDLRAVNLEDRGIKQRIRRTTPAFARYSESRDRSGRSWG